MFGLAERCFGDWAAGETFPVEPRPALGLTAHLPDDSQQTHFTLTGRGVSPRSPDWFAWHLSLTALSGGSASRLFHAVREERGLAYSVHAGPQVVGGEGLLSGYAASTPQRAPETLAVMLSELQRWRRGLTAEEFERAKHALLASTVFGSESIRVPQQRAWPAIWRCSGRCARPARCAARSASSPWRASTPFCRATTPAR